MRESNKRDLHKVSRLHRRRVFVRVTYLTLSLLLVLSLGFFFFRGEVFHVTSVKVSGTKTIAEASVREYVDALLVGSKALFIRKDNTIFLSTAVIAGALQESFPRLASVSVSRDGLHALDITVSERDPEVLWCGVSESAAGGCYFVDPAGVVYASAPVVGGNIFIRIYAPLTSGEEGAADDKIVGHYVYDKNSYHELLQIKDFLLSRGFRVSKVLITRDGDCTLFAQDGRRIMYNCSQGEKQFEETYTVAFSADPLKGRESSYEYLDFRFGNRLFFKLAQ